MKFNFNLLLMTLYDPVQEHQTVGWSQKTTLNHVIMMSETFSFLFFLKAATLARSSAKYNRNAHRWCVVIR